MNKQRLTNARVSYSLPAEDFSGCHGLLCLWARYRGAPILILLLRLSRDVLEGWERAVIHVWNGEALPARIPQMGTARVFVETLQGSSPPVLYNGFHREVL